MRKMTKRETQAIRDKLRAKAERIHQGYYGSDRDGSDDGGADNDFWVSHLYAISARLARGKPLTDADQEEINKL